jgi:hypothetical protein
VFRSFAGDSMSPLLLSISKDKKGRKLVTDFSDDFIYLISDLGRLNALERVNFCVSSIKDDEARKNFGISSVKEDIGVRNSRDDSNIVMSCVSIGHITDSIGRISLQHNPSTEDKVFSVEIDAQNDHSPAYMNNQVNELLKDLQSEYGSKVREASTRSRKLKSTNKVRVKAKVKVRVKSNKIKILTLTLILIITLTVTLTSAITPIIISD